jgi:formylglycine-generating enzyme required for sulfatase activity
MRKLIILLAGLLLACALHAEESPDLPQEIVVNGVEFLRVPGGWFYLSIPDRDPKTGNTLGRGAREVKAWVDTFYIGKYEARGRDFVRFMNSGTAQYAKQYGPMPGREWSDGEHYGCAVRKDASTNKYYLVAPQLDLPATHLSWDLANEFATWMGFRLPTNAEWVRSFRGDDRRIFPWGDEYPDDTFAGFQEGATACDVRPVTGYPKGRSPYGVYNMAGNVYEYVADWLNFEYMAQMQDGVRNPLATVPYQTPDDKKPHRILRGGRWASGVGQLSIYGNRDIQPTDEGFRCFGARFVLDVNTLREHLARGTATIVH